MSSSDSRDINRLENESLNHTTKEEDSSVAVLEFESKDDLYHRLRFGNESPAEKE